MSFPSSPTDGQLYTNSLGTQYIYNSTKAAWLIQSQGLTGIQGLTGLGGQGATGIQGLTGVGPQGVTGIALGQTGIQGVTGFRGGTGIQGVTGLQGMTGIQGVTGIQGGTGLFGATGIQGNTGIRGLTGVQGIFEFQFYSDQLDNPNSSDWKVNSLAPASQDTSNSALTVRRFDDSTEEGVGFLIETPSASTNMALSLRSRVQTAPTTAKQVVVKLYNREFPDNLVVTAWSAGTTLTPLDFTSNTYFQYDAQTVTLSTLGLTAGRITQFELTRSAADATDTLVGDWDLAGIKLNFS